MITPISNIRCTSEFGFNVRALTLPEVSSAFRKFNTVIGPMVAQATAMTLHSQRSAGHQQTVQNALQCSGAMLDHLLQTASIEEMAESAVSGLPMPVKIEALGAILRLTLETIPLADLKISLAIAAISTITASPTVQWVPPQSDTNAVN